MKIKYLFLCLLVLPLIGAGCTPEQMEDPQAAVEVMDLLEEFEEREFRGSCNAIAAKSTCVDYVGSFWTKEQMELNCQGPEVVFNETTCPYSTLGGCAATPDTMTETIAWSYDYGGQPLSAEEAGYQAMACNTISISKWVTAEEANKIEGDETDLGE
jgi:hypothetical protein